MDTPSANAIVRRMSDLSSVVSRIAQPPKQTSFRATWTGVSNCLECYLRR